MQEGDSKPLHAEGTLCCPGGSFGVLTVSKAYIDTLCAIFPPKLLVFLKENKDNAKETS